MPLAGWWQRVLALVLDSLIVGIVGGLVALPVVRDVVDIYSDWFDDAISSDAELDRHRHSCRRDLSSRSRSSG